MQKTMKKILSIILAILMIVTSVPIAFAADDTPDFSDAKVLTANEKGILCIDGVEVEYDTYTVTSIYLGYDQYLPSGKYKLSGDVTMHKNGFINIEEGENVSVDLNGYTWNCNECTYTDGTFSVYDTSKDEKGKITSAYGQILVRGDGEFNLYSGTIEDSKGGVVLRVVEGTANLYGGKLKSNEYTIGHILSENAKINLGGTVLESEEGYPEIESFILSSKVPQGVINVADYTGESLTVEIVADYTGESLAGKIKILEGVENAQEAEKYTIKFYKNDSYYLDKTEYNEETGEMFAYTAKYTFTQQPSAENGYTVDFNNPDATFQWYEVEETILTPDNVTAIEGVTFENGKWLNDGWYVEFFTVDVNAGDIITASTTSDYSFDLNVYTEDYSIEEYVTTTGKASVTIDSDAEVIVGVNVDNVVPTEFEFELIKISEIDETETDKTLQNPECGKTYVCKISAGENVYLSDVVTVGHNIVSVDTQAPTCTEIGWDAYEYCTACDYTTYAEKAPHSDTLVKVDAKAPTCTEIGWEAYEYCTACDYTTYAEKAPHSDTLVKVDAKAPTCTEIGWDAYEYCTACDYTTYVEIVDPDAHDYTNHYCKRCGKAEDGYYAGACGANGDNLNWSLDSDGVLTISGEGEMQEISSYKQQPWKDYSSDIKEVVIEEGVTKIAELAFYALFELEKVTISSTAEFEDFCYCFISCSSLKEFIVSPANPYYCTDEYGVIFSKDKKTLLRGVDLSDVDYVIPDTVTSVAKQAFDGIKIKSLIVNVTSMDMFLNAAIDKLIVDCANVERSAFAYTTIGEVILTNKVIEISKYAFNGSIITSAHYLGDPANLTIEANENESLTDVLHYCEHKEALAPTCTEIGWEAYEYCTACDYTTKVEKEALNHKDTLVQVDAKAPTCTEIGWDAYEYCTACDYTTKVEIPVDPDAHDYTNHYCKRCGKAEDGYYAAGACGATGDNLNWSLDSDGVLTISGEGEMQEMFIYLDQPWKDYRRDIKEIVIEEGVTKIAEAAFYLLTNLEKVTISSTAEFEDFSYCFIACSSLKDFIVSPANPYYCTDEYGVVFSKDKSKLIKAFDLSDVDYVIPDTVTSVAEEAFDGIKIKSIIVNIALESMFSDAEIGKLIVDCANVEAFAFAFTTIGEVVLTNKVSFIGYSAFGGAVITSAHYLGDPANLTIDANENESLTDVLHYCEHKEGLAPTCTEIGWDAYEYCTECDYTTKVEIPVDPDAHDIIIDKAVAPDCENTGLTEGQHCSRCNNATIAQEVIPALNHKDTLVQVDAKAPTCTEIGWDAYKYCTACTYTTYVEKEALNHKDTLVQVEAKAPTCTEIGWDAYEHCTACDYTTYVEIPENGHTPLDAVRENEVASKCGLAGSYDLVVYCACGEELDRDKFTVEALKHSFTKYEETEAPKCGVEGKKVAYCDNGCGEIDEKTIEALRHSFTKYEETEAPKCGVEGKEVAYCDNGCGEADEKAVAALRHSFTKYEVIEEAKCGVAGKKVAVCDNGCGETDEKAIEALEHSLVLIKTTPAECGVPMVEFYNCEFCCNCEVAKPKFGTALFHSFTKYEITEAPTCNKTGEKAAPCDNGCGEIDVQTVPALDDHVDADGDYKCDFGCGHEFEKPAPEEPTPDTPDEPTDSTCDHLCHKSGILGFFWKIVKFFSKLFKLNPVCECGAAHY